MKKEALVELLKSTDSKDMKIVMDNLFKHAKSQGASDVHLFSNGTIGFRISGKLIDDPTKLFDMNLSNDLVERLVYSVISDKARGRYERGRDRGDCFLDVGYKNEVTGTRGHVSGSGEGMDAVFRLIPYEIPKLEDLGLPNDALQQRVKLRRGLILIVGDVNSGKSTTLAAYLDLVNKSREDRICTIEDPIEYYHIPQKCKIVQREIGRDTRSYFKAVKAVLRQDSNVILVGEVRDKLTAMVIIRAVETGHVVASTMHAKSAAEAVRRYMDLIGDSDEDKSKQRREQFASNLSLVIAQKLVPKIGGGRVLAAEVMIPTVSIKSGIRLGRIQSVIDSMYSGRDEGMVRLEYNLTNLYEKKLITRDHAKEYANDQSLIEDLLTGIDRRVNPPKDTASRNFIALGSTPEAR